MHLYHFKHCAARVMYIRYQLALVCGWNATLVFVEPTYNRYAIKNSSFQEYEVL